jgi:sterol 3beta-glucosyltransferase
MRAVFTNFGSRGDFQPLCALAMHAREQGHTPLFVIPSFAEKIVRSFGLECVCVDGDLLSLRDQVNQNWISDSESYLDPRKLCALLAPFEQHLTSTFETLTNECLGADVLISGAAQPLGRVAHEYLGIPFVSVQFCHFGGTGGPALDSAGEQLINPFRRKLGLPEIAHPLTSGANSPQLALYAMSPSLFSRHPEWPAHYQLTGYWFAPESDVADLDLRRFIEEGSPPVVITFGSMADALDRNLEELALHTCQKAGLRAVIQGAERTGRVGELVYSAGFVSHAWLFRRASCIVSHGGAGTAAATFRAGVPGVFVPHIHDQMFWAQMAHEKGCAVPPLLLSALSSERLASTIRLTLDDHSIQSLAIALGRKIRNENGVSTAWNMIDNLIAHTGFCS